MSDTGSSRSPFPALPSSSTAQGAGKSPDRHSACPRPIRYASAQPCLPRSPSPMTASPPSRTSPARYPDARGSHQPVPLPPAPGRSAPAHPRPGAGARRRVGRRLRRPPHPRSLAAPGRLPAHRRPPPDPGGRLQRLPPPTRRQVPGPPRARRCRPRPPLHPDRPPPRSSAPISPRTTTPPVTPQQAPGHTTHSWIQWLTPEQLEAVAATEGPAYTLLTASDPGRWLALDHVQSPPRRFAVWCIMPRSISERGVVVFAGNPAAGPPADPRRPVRNGAPPSPGGAVDASGGQVAGLGWLLAAA